MVGSQVYEYHMKGLQTACAAESRSQSWPSGSGVFEERGGEAGCRGWDLGRSHGDTVR